jgi:hypothetical protein
MQSRVRPSCGSRSDRSAPRSRRDRCVIGSSTLCCYGTGERHPVWPNRDPLGEKGGRNLFCFAANDPIAKHDPLGKVPNPLVPQAFPADQVRTPPEGPFEKCNVALQCGPAFMGVVHCGLIIDTDSGVYSMSGSGGSINLIFLVPASLNDATGPWSSHPSSACECLMKRVNPWNGMRVSRDNLANNSNWNLKCMLTGCNMATTLNWGSQQKPLGYNARYPTYNQSAGVGLGNPYACQSGEEIPCPALP